MLTVVRGDAFVSPDVLKSRSSRSKLGEFIGTEVLEVLMRLQSGSQPGRIG